MTLILTLPDRKILRIAADGMIEGDVAHGAGAVAARILAATGARQHLPHAWLAAAEAVVCEMEATLEVEGETAEVGSGRPLIH